MALKVCMPRRSFQRPGSHPLGDRTIFGRWVLDLHPPLKKSISSIRTSSRTLQSPKVLWWQHPEEHPGRSEPYRATSKSKQQKRTELTYVKHNGQRMRPIAIYSNCAKHAKCQIKGVCQSISNFHFMHPCLCSHSMLTGRSFRKFHSFWCFDSCVLDSEFDGLALGRQKRVVFIVDRCPAEDVPCGAIERQAQASEVAILISLVEPTHVGSWGWVHILTCTSRIFKVDFHKPRHPQMERTLQNKQRQQGNTTL